MTSSSTLQLHQRLLWITTLCITALYGALLVPWPVSGMSAYLTALHLGLDPQAVIGHPLYRILLAALEKISAGSLGLRLNLVALLCTVGGLVLFHRMAFAFFEATNLTARGRLCAWCAAFATWIAAASLPMWWTGTRASPGSLHFLLAMIVGWILVVYARAGNSRHLYMFLFAYGVSAIEYASLLLLAPLVLCFCLYLMYRHRHLAAPKLAAGALFGMAGLATSGLAATWFLWSPAAAAAGLDTWPAVFWAYWMGLLRGAARTVPTTGWLLVLFVSVLPFIGCLWLAFRKPADALRGIGPQVMLMGMCLAAVLAGWWMTRVSPWVVLGEVHVVVLPSVLVGLTAGYAAGFFYLLPVNMYGVKPAAVRAAHITLVLLAVVVCISPLRYHREIDPRPRLGLWGYACEMVRSMEQRDLLLVQDQDDYLLRLAAREQQHKLLLLIPSQASSPAQKRAIAGVLGDARLQSLGDLSLMSLVKEILAQRPDLVVRLACAGNAGLLSGYGYMAVPQGLVYVPVREASVVDADRLFALQQDVHARLMPTLGGDDVQVQPEEASLQARRWYASRMANDLGVLLEHVQRADLAESAYGLARQANPRNISALLNLAALVAEHRPAEELWTEASRLAERARFPLGQLVVLFGHIRRPEAVAFLRDLWVAPAETAASASEPALVEVYAALAAGHQTQAVARVEAALQAQPKSIRAWWLRGLLAERMKDDKKWKESWQAMLDLQQEWPMFLMIEGRRRLAADDREGARALLERAYARWPENLGLGEIVAQLHVDSEQYDQAQAVVKRMASIDPGSEPANRMLGFLEFRAGRWTQSEASFRAALRVHTNAVNALYLALACWKTGQESEARTWYGRARAENRGAIPSVPPALAPALQELSAHLAAE